MAVVAWFLLTDPAMIIGLLVSIAITTSNYGSALWLLLLSIEYAIISIHFCHPDIYKT